jgi:hypothetical protein
MLKTLIFIAKATLLEILIFAKQKLKILGGRRSADRAARILPFPQRQAESALS